MKDNPHYKNFFLMLSNNFDDCERLFPFIEKNLSEAGVTKITVEPLKYGSGVSFPSRIVLSTTTLKYNIQNFLFTLFHELAHQHQFKKYGYDKMMRVYSKETEIQTATKLIYEIEIVADSFSERKLREMVKLNLLSSTLSLPTGHYKKTPLQTFLHTISTVQEMVKGLDYEDAYDLGEKLYQMIKIKP